MKIGCFALIHPFRPLEAQLKQIADWGFDNTDVTDNGDGATLGSDGGFSALASLDGNFFDLKRQFDKYGLRISSFCAHGKLLDASAPWRYGSAQIIKAVRAAAALGVQHVVTTEGEPATPFGRGLNDSERIFSIREKLHEPLRMAADYGIKILMEPHGPVSDSMEDTERLLNACDSPALGLNLDTGNLWLGGGDPVAYVKKFGKLIEHVHWKDMPADMESQRGKIFGCGMGVIPLGRGVVDIAGTLRELNDIGFDGDTTLEVAGETNVLESREYLLSL